MATARVDAHGAASRHAQTSGSSIVDRLKTELHGRVAETLNAVCGAFEKELELAAQPPPPPEAGVADYDTYNDCCQRLVAYISASMAPSPQFTQQMDRIILACHSSASERVLNSLVTKDVWFRLRDRVRDEGGDGSQVAGSQSEQTRDSFVLVEAPGVAEPVIKAENVPVDGVQRSESQPATAAGTSATPDVAVTTTAQAGSNRASRKRLSTGRHAAISSAPAKRLRQEKAPLFVHSESSVGEDSSQENAESEEGVDVGGDADMVSSLFGLSTESETEDEGKDSGEVEDEGKHSDEEEDEEWVEGEEEDDDVEDEDSGEDGGQLMRVATPDTIGELCYPDRRSLGQTKVFKERVRKSIQFVDALLCRPPRGKFCSRNCKQLRTQRCLNVAPCRSEMCQVWHEANAHIPCCRNSRCEYKIRLTLRETMHQIEHQHQRLENVRVSLRRRKKELVAVKFCGPLNPEQTSEATLLGKQIELLERELTSEEEQLAFYHCVKKENVDAAIEASIDTVSDFADFGTHYVQEAKGLLAAQSAVSSQPLPKKDELLASEDVIGKLCYAGQRSQQQTELFKERLRKSIVFVDALLCKPPPGKVCSRDCKKICAQRCTEDVPCANQMCRNWHDAEAHTDHCLNPQCEFKLRIVLRETMHKIDHKRLLIQKERAKVRKKKAELAAIIAEKPSEREDFMDAAEREEFTGAMQRERFVECTLLEDEIEQLERDLKGEKQELRRFSDAKKNHWAMLHTIGIEEADDATDHFPDFETRYATRKRARK